MPRLFPAVPHDIADSKTSKKTKIHSFPRSGREQRISLPGSRRAYELSWTGISLDDYDVINAFFNEMDGEATPFVFWHPDLDENIYMRFDGGDLTFQTIKTDVYYLSVSVIEVLETYTDPTVGEILVDIAGVRNA